MIGEDFFDQELNNLEEIHYFEMKERLIKEHFDRLAEEFLS